ncbi:MAG: hypothetical protein K6A34_08115 [Methanobrevibacter sp.]|nr:hypothetical protein [Methanobrevibacter sp.]
MYSEINKIKSDEIEIDCQGIYDAIIACQREFDNNLVFEKTIKETLSSIEELLYTVNEIELFGDMVELIYRFKYFNRELESQMKFVDDMRMNKSKNLAYIISEMAKFKVII